MLRRSCKRLTIAFSSHSKNYKRTFLTNDYKCEVAWIAQKSSPILNKVNLNDFFTTLNQNYNSKGVISAIDVDIFANAINDPIYLDELKDLLLKLRTTAETGNTLESTHHATVRNYLEYGNLQDLINILKDPLSYGVFLDDFSANILLDKLVTSNDYELAANVAALIMLQEEFSNEITCSLSQYACYKYLSNFNNATPVVEEVPDSKKKVEEVKIRIKFLRNFYYDDHFDIKELSLLSGKTLAWISRKNSNNINNNLQIIGWTFYKKYNTLLDLCESLKKSQSFKIYKEVVDMMQKELDKCKDEKSDLDKCVSLLHECPKAETSLEESIKNLVEDSINKLQKNDIMTQQKLFQSWTSIREKRLKEQIQRLDRAQRLEMLKEKQKELNVEEQKLWFFENEDKIDLEIESKEKEETKVESKAQKISDENYIPPEILPKRR